MLPEKQNPWLDLSANSTVTTQNENPWLNLTGAQGNQDAPQQPRDPAHGSTGILPMSRQLMPEGYQGQGEDYYGDTTGQVGGLGIGENLRRDFNAWSAAKNSRLNAPSLVRGEDGLYHKEDPTLAQKGARLVGETITGIGDLFSLPAKGVKAVLGVSRGIEDLADIAQSPLPDIFKQDTGLNLFLQPALNVYNGLRIATGSRRLTSDEMLRAVDANLQASEIAYTSLSDPAIRNEYLRRYLNGENPDYLTKELENPWHELIGEVALDPLNVVDFFVSKAGKVANVAKMAERFTTTLPEISKAVSIAPELENGVVAGLRAMDNAKSAAVIPEVAQVVSKEALKVANGMKTSQGYGNALSRRLFTANTRRENLAETMGTVFAPLMAAYSNDPDSAAETIRAMTLIGSGDARRTEEALRILKAAPNDLSNVILSQGGMETANMLHRMMPNGIDDFVDLLKTGDKEKLLADFTKRMDNAAEDLFPTVTQQVTKLQETIKVGGDAAVTAQKELDAIPSYVKGINALNENLQKVYSPINGFFSDVYIVANPGTQVRNLLGNLTHTFVDIGPQAAADVLGNTVTGVARAFGGDVAAELPADIATRKMLGGSLPRGASVSLGSAGEAAKKSLIPQWVRNAAAQTERAASSAVVYNSVKRTMKQALKEGIVTPKLAELTQAGLSEGAAKRYVNLLQTEFFGDHEKAWVKIQQEFTDGVVESWRNPRDWMSPADIRNMEQSGLLSQIEQIAQNSTNLPDAMRQADVIVQKQMATAAGVLDETPQRYIDDWGDNYDLAGEPYVSSDEVTTFTIKRTAMANARESYYNMARNILNDPSAPHNLRLELADFRDGLNSHAARDGQRLAETANRASNLANTDPAKAWNLLQRTPYGKNLPPLPEGATAQQIRDFIWQQWYYPNRSNLWSDVAVQMRQKTTEFAQQAMTALGKDPKGLQMSPEFLRAEQAFQYAQKVERSTYVSGQGLIFDAVDEALNAKNPAGALTTLANRYGIPTATKDGKPTKQLLNTINKHSDTSYEKLEDVPFEAAQDALQKWAIENQKDVSKTIGFSGERLPIPRYYNSETMPTGARMAAEGLSGTMQSVSRFKSQLQKVWGQGESVQRLAPEVEVNMAKIGSRVMQRVTEARVVASAVANQTRDFTLLAYSKKTYLDLALAYVYPYSFYHTRALGHWTKRLVTNPTIVSGYFKYRNAMESAHANLPDYWKYNINSDELLGIDTGNPLFFNLEATLNPLNAITGIDYSDPDRIVGAEGSGLRWWTQTLDGMGKFGPSTWTPLTMLTAAALYNIGEKEAALAWGGRMIPQTAAIKSASSFFGQPLELDPAVLWFGAGEGENRFFDAKEKHERSRIGRAATAMISEGANQAEMLRQLAEEKGPLYDEAYRRAVKNRAPWQLLSFIGGSGFKARTQEDVQVDQFYDEYRRLWAQRDNLSTDEFNTAMNSMKDQYPFMDAVLLSKRAGIDRDRGYAYIVMSRIAPGYNKEVGEFVGMDPRLLDKFYEDKGDTSKWPKADSDIFYAKISEIGATLDVPPNSVRQEWALAKNEYSRMNAAARVLYGGDIDNLVTTFYETPADYKEQFLTQHPNVREYMQWRSGYIANEPILATYYDGMENLESWWKGNFRKEAATQFGPNIFNTLSQYYYLKDTSDKKVYDAFYKAHPEIKKYNSLKETWDARIDKIVTDFGKRLPEGVAPLLQKPRDGQSLGQQDLRTGLTQQGPSWAEIAPTLAQDLQTEINAYVENGKPLTYSTRTRLEYKAKDLGMTLNELMQLAGMESSYANP